jgi:hypothetical protein
MEGTYVGGAEEPFALGAVFDCYAGEGDILLGLGLGLGGWRGVFDWGCWFCHFPFLLSFSWERCPSISRR